MDWIIVCNENDYNKIEKIKEKNYGYSNIIKSLKKEFGDIFNYIIESDHVVVINPPDYDSNIQLMRPSAYVLGGLNETK